MYQNDPQRVLTAEVRLSYAHLTKPSTRKPGEEPRYSVSLLIPKTDTATYNDILSAIEAAAQEATPKLWNGERPAIVQTTLYDGDGAAKPKGGAWGEECHGHWVLRAASKNKPQVVSQANIKAELPPSDIYSGMYAQVTLRFYGYNNENGKGVGCGLGNVMKTRDGEAFSSQTTAAQDFAGIAPAAPPVAPAAHVPSPAGYPAASPPSVDPLTGRPYGG